MNAMACLEYAVNVLKVKHVIVCGHYGCGGVRAAMNPDQLGLIDNWLRHIRDVYYHNYDECSHLNERRDLENYLCELNVKQSVRAHRVRRAWASPWLTHPGAAAEEAGEAVRPQFLHVCSTTIVQAAWARKQSLRVHGWVYSIEDGLLKEIDPGVASQEELHAVYQVGPPRSLMSARRASTDSLPSLASLPAPGK